jgi:hypothetical protein
VLQPGFCCTRVCWCELLQVEWRQLLQRATQVACRAERVRQQQQQQERDRELILQVHCCVAGPCLLC